MDTTMTGEMRLVDLLAALSLVADLGMGQPPEEALRACLLATTLARRMGVDADDGRDVYYTTLLRYIGCTSYAHEEAALAGGNDIALRAAGARVDFGNPREALPFMLGTIGCSASLPRRVGLIGGLIVAMGRGDTTLERSHCEVASAMARRIGLGRGIQQSLAQLFERWDGKGAPRKLAADNIALPARFAQVATQALLFARLNGLDAALSMIRQRAGTALDPSIASAFLLDGPALLTEMAATDVWAAVVDAEPDPPHWIAEAQLDAVARAFADMVDLKVPCMRGHSSGVAALAEGAAHALGLPTAEAVAMRRASLLHDLGRVGVPNGIWEKRGTLTRGEWEQVRLHPYHTERILACAPVLAPLARIAGMHHERQDGSGYHRQAAGAMVPLTARVLAAADAYQAMTQERPHRPALPPLAAARQLAAGMVAGQFDADAVRAVLTAAGQDQIRARRTWPAGLSDREVEVLRLIAGGCSYRDVARLLTITPKTAEHHISHIYTKIEVSTRAAAALFAMEHDLVTH